MAEMPRSPLWWWMLLKEGFGLIVDVEDQELDAGNGLESRGPEKNVLPVFPIA